MKYLSTKHLNKIGKTALALVLAGTYAFSSPISFAAEENDDMQNYEVVELPDNLNEEQSAADAETVSSSEETSADTGENTTDSANDTTEVGTETATEEADDTAEGTDTTEADNEEENAADQNSEAPALLPGDVFYFVKIVFEKIQLAFTVDDVKEAKLLAEFSAERLAEAEGLFAEGKDAEALETIKKAVEYLEGSEGQLGEDAPEETTSDEQSTVEEDTAVTEEEGTAADDNAASEDGNSVGEETADNTDEEGTEEVRELISQNIIALTAAMEKVKNPTAKAALKKNIEKSFVKLEKKAAKMAAKEERKAAKIAEKRAAEEEATDVENNTAAESQTPVVNNTGTESITTPAPESTPAAETLEANEVEIETTEPVTPVPAPPTVSTEQKPALQESVNQSKAQVKAETKQIKENAKQEAKANRTEAKQEAKADRNEAKQEVKQKQTEMNQNHKQNQAQ